MSSAPPAHAASGEGRIELVPDPETRIHSGDLLVAIGDREGLTRIAQLATRFG